MSTDLHFRKAEASELPLALSLLKEAALWLQGKETEQWSFWLNPPPEKIAWIKEGFDAEEFSFVYAGKDLVGMFRLMYFDKKYWGQRPDRFDKAAYIHSLCIRTKYKGQQIGSKILRKVEERLRSEEVPKFRLDCMKANTGLCQYYENEGFKKVGEVEMAWAVQNLYEKIL